MVMHFEVFLRRDNRTDEFEPVAVVDHNDRTVGRDDSEYLRERYLEKLGDEGVLWTTVEVRI